MENYEKKYKEALERAKDFIEKQNPPAFDKNLIVTIFPELKESEDERIREEIISALKWANHKGVYDKHIAWLENLDKQKSFDYENANIQQKDFAPKDEEMKELLRTEYEKGRADTIAEMQSERKPADKVEPKFKVGDIIIKSQNSDINKFGKFKITGIKDGRYWYNEFVICEISEQDEWELVKIEPKFHEGDWILYSGDYYEGVRHITKIDENGYYIERNGLPHGIIPFNHEICMRLWTIQDAKDGDVLVDNYGNVVIYQEPSTKLMYHSYCYGNHKCFIDMGGSHEIVGSYPATKEQRDILFSKMKEAGYEWNAEKKELKKIELNEWVPKKGDVCKPKKGENNILLCDQDGIAFSFVEYVKNGCAGGEISIPTLLRDYELVEPKDYNTFDISFNAKDSELQEVSYHIPEGFHAEINGDKVIIKKGEKEKPTNKEMKELFRTEYEKGRADVLNKIDSEQLESFIELCNDLQMRSTNESLYDELEKLKNWIKNL